MSKNKEAVGNLGEEETNFLKHVRMTRDDTRKDANALFSVAHQSRDRDNKLMEKLFIQTPSVMTMSNQLLKNASADQWEQYEKIKVAYNVHHFFESGSHLTEAQRRYPELQKVAKVRPVVQMKKSPDPAAATGTTANGATMSGAST